MNNESEEKFFRSSSTVCEILQFASSCTNDDLVDVNRVWKRQQIANGVGDVFRLQLIVLQQYVRFVLVDLGGVEDVCVHETGREAGDANLLVLHANQFTPHDFRRGGYRVFSAGINADLQQVNRGDVMAVDGIHVDDVAVRVASLHRFEGQAGTTNDCREVQVDVHRKFRHRFLVTGIKRGIT